MCSRTRYRCEVLSFLVETRGFSCKTFFDSKKANDASCVLTVSCTLALHVHVQMYVLLCSPVFISESMTLGVLGELVNQN